jgi:hypothetical protein
MYEENQPFGIVKDSMKAEVESYVDDLLSRAMSYLRLGDTQDPKNQYMQHMAERNIPSALACQAVYNAQLRAESDGVECTPQFIKARLIIISEKLKDDAIDLVQTNDLGFIESMSIEEVQQQLSQAYVEYDMPAIVFYVCAYMLHMKMRKISGVD